MVSFYKSMTPSPIQCLRNHGLRPSPQRLAVFKYLSDHRTHPTVDTVYNDLLPLYPTLSRTTVYQTLDALCTSGLAKKLTIEEHLMRFDADTSNHGHFLCVKCNTVFDFFYPDKTSFPKPDGGFAIQQVRLYMYGVCPTCQKKQ